jgi:hypothetical protein
MNKCLLTFTTFIFINIGNIAIAQEDFYNKPQITTNGDYITNASPIKGKVIKGTFQAGSLWRVITPNLNCRKNPNIHSEIIRSFNKNTILQADVGGGGADEVIYNAKDDQGKTWMRTRSKNGIDYNCYVRANKKYIQPVIK